MTHATPGAGFAHTPERDWESDAHMRDVDANCNSIKDIAAQLIDDNDLNVSAVFHLRYSDSFSLHK